jgi:hypothetical protein
MEDGEMPGMHKYGENKTTRIMIATVRHMTPGSGLKKISSRLIFVEQRVPFVLRSKQRYFSLHIRSFKAQW